MTATRQLPAPTADSACVPTVSRHVAWSRALRYLLAISIRHIFVAHLCRQAQQAIEKSPHYHEVINVTGRSRPAPGHVGADENCVQKSSAQGCFSRASLFWCLFQFLSIAIKPHHMLGLNTDPYSEVDEKYINSETNNIDLTPYFLKTTTKHALLISQTSKN